jgi:hypothetical protein
MRGVSLRPLTKHATLHHFDPIARRCDVRASTVQLAWN